MKQLNLINIHKILVLSADTNQIAALILNSKC